MAGIKPRFVTLERDKQGRHEVGVDLNELLRLAEENAKAWNVDKREALKRMGYEMYFDKLKEHEGFEFLRE